MHICLAIPTYNDTLSVPTHRALTAAASHLPDGVGLVECVRGGSLLCLNFNLLWCDALNLRTGLDLPWFVMLHGDMGSPEPYWLTNLLALAEQHGLDALSAVSPIKDATTEVSTALYRQGDGRIQRLTAEQLAGWPETVSADWVEATTGETLLINTGMLALRLDRDWSEEFAFAMQDAIHRTEEGRFVAHTLSEDWSMSLWLRARGIPYGVTRAVPVVHAGAWRWTHSSEEK